jgi:V/A-type H+/Na+-transporting ATPase subunit A
MRSIQSNGQLTRVAGPVVVAQGLGGVAMYDLVQVGRARLIGEVIRLDRRGATIQVYEDTSGLRVGDPVADSGGPLQVELGPGLLGTVYDGIQRPLLELREAQGPFLQPAAVIAALNRERSWEFVPQMRLGDTVEPGDVLGTVQETARIAHAILVPLGIRGVIEHIHAGAATVEATVATVREHTTGALRLVDLIQRWPVRARRPYRRKLDPQTPLITGQRVIDTFFPIARGGAAIIPGGFGTGKTVLEQTLAKWSDADIVVYIGCGERGNEMTEVLEEFPHLLDPRTGAPLMQRTVLIANTSNMPVAAREASIYTGITIAEYYRDMGYHVALLADSTSRWGEALREVSGRLEELPGTEGYPAYLGTRLADFYERAGRVETLGRGERIGSVTAIGAVSPPGADFSEPITQGSLRVAGAFWALDYALSRSRHFPAINWTRSYSLFDLRGWFNQHVAPEWSEQAKQAMALLQREAELLEIVQLVGQEGLSERDQALLQVARLLREDFLQQVAGDDVDTFCPPEKQRWMLRAILAYNQTLSAALERGVVLGTALAQPVATELGRLKTWPMPAAIERIQALIGRIEGEMGAL